MPSARQITIAAASLLVSCATLSQGHTWIEEFQGISSDGSFVGERGFSRGYVARTDPGFDGNSNLWMLPSLEARNPDGTVRNKIDNTDPLCHPAQRSSNYTNSQYPMLKVEAGGYVAMKYLENGHVTLPWTLQGKPEAGGTVLVFATSDPQPEEKMTTVLQWNKDGSGGDKRGFLLAAMNYDDGECHQLNECWVSAERQILHPNNIPEQGDAQAEKWCESDIKIPDNQPAGQLAVYWVWQWGTEVGADCFHPEGKDEWYTNCADIEIVASGGATGNQKLAAEGAAPALEQQDPNSRAVKNFASRTAAASSWPSVFAGGANNKIAATATSAKADPSWVSSCQASILADQSAVAANPQALPPNCPAGSYAPTGANYTLWSASIKAKATDMPAPTAARSTTAPPMTSAPASTPAAASSPPAAATASSASSGGVTVITETVITISTVTVPATPAPEAVTPAPDAATPAPDAATPAPDAATPAPDTAAAPSVPPAAAADGEMNGYPIISPPGGPHGGRPDEHAAAHRRHARAFR